MPIYEYECRGCGVRYEELVLSGKPEACPVCGKDIVKVLSVSSGLSGKGSLQTPQDKGHGCCGEVPSERGCIPGSCCGKG